MADDTPSVRSSTALQGSSPRGGRWRKYRRGFEILGATITIFVVLAVVLAVYYPSSRPTGEGPGPTTHLPYAAQRVQTADGWTLMARSYPSDPHASAAVVLVHDGSGTLEGWHRTAVRLQQAGYPTLAVGVRGDGLATAPDGSAPSWGAPTLQQVEQWEQDLVAAIALSSGTNRTVAIVASADAGIAALAVTGSSRPSEGSVVILLSPPESVGGRSLPALVEGNNGTIVAFGANGSPEQVQALSRIDRAAVNPHHVELVDGDSQGQGLLAEGALDEALLQWLPPLR